MASKQSQPLWLQMVQRFERAIGVPVESALRSDAYFDYVTQANRARARLTALGENLAEQWLHAFNLPAATDLRRLREQLSRVERELIAVAKDIADSQEAGEEPRRQLARVERQLAKLARELDGRPPRAKPTPRRAKGK
jgi:chromosome segregation ATPase